MPSTAASSDPRVRCADYSPDGVIVLMAAVGGTLLIEIPDGERVIAVPTSDNGLMRGSSVAAPRVVTDADDNGETRGTADRSLAVAVRREKSTHSA